MHKLRKLLPIIIGLMLLNGFAVVTICGAFSYDRFKGNPWPNEVIDKMSFKFQPSEKDKKGILLPWNKLAMLEAKNPTFDGPNLSINDPELAKLWAETYRKAAWATRPKQIMYVNHFFNRFDYGEDIDVWGVRDYWPTPREFMEKKIGDCKAIAIAKYYALITLGVSMNDMYMVTVNDPTAPKGAYHLVLVVFDGQDQYVLDMDPNRGASKNSAYRKYKVFDYFNETGSWEVK